MESSVDCPLSIVHCPLFRCRYITGRGVPQLTSEGLRQLLEAARELAHTVSPAGIDAMPAWHPALFRQRDFDKTYVWKDPMLEEDLIAFDEDTARK